MIAVLSPAKNLHIHAAPHLALTRPLHMDRTMQLVRALAAYAPHELESVLCVGFPIALRAYDAYQRFDEDAAGGAAALAFEGLAYKYLDARAWSAADLQFAQDHLRILSALYGALRPLDGIQPYRLELMGKWRMEGQTLYQFWGDTMYRDVFASGQVVINLCSREYEKALRPFLQSGDRMVTCDFLVNKWGKMKMLPTAAKMARGSMARYLVQNRLEAPEQLKAFDELGFAFVPALSSADHYTFLQK